MIKGYYNNDAANRESYDSDGFYHTGDIGLCDGKTKKWYIVDRKKVNPCRTPAFVWIGINNRYFGSYRSLLRFEAFKSPHQSWRESYWNIPTSLMQRLSELLPKHMGPSFPGRMLSGDLDQTLRSRRSRNT